MHAIQKSFARDFPEHKSMLTSRGASALYLAFSMIRAVKGPGEVIVPATVCLSVPLAAWYAGLTPRFADVEMETLCLSDRTVAPCLSDKTLAVVAVHLFGKAVPSNVFELARSRGLLVVEDAAQAVGGGSDGVRLGARGDFSIFSFDDKKILPGRGGALLVKDPKCFSSVPTLPSPVEELNFKEISMSFRDFSTGIHDLLRSNPDFNALLDFTPLWEGYHSLFVAGPPNAAATWERANIAYERLVNDRAARHRNYSLYRKHLAPNVAVQNFSAEEMCWRLPILMKSHQAQLEAVHQIRALGSLASNHYFSATPFFGVKSPPNATQIGLRVVNVWVDGKARPENIPRVCEIINSLC